MTRHMLLYDVTMEQVAYYTTFDGEINTVYNWMNNIHNISTISISTLNQPSRTIYNDSVLEMEMVCRMLSK